MRAPRVSVFGDESRDQSHGTRDVAAPAILGMRRIRNVRLSGGCVFIGEIEIDVGDIVCFAGVDCETPLWSAAERVAVPLESIRSMCALLIARHGMPQFAIAGLPEPVDLLVVFGREIGVDIVRALRANRDYSIGVN